MPKHEFLSPAILLTVAPVLSNIMATVPLAFMVKGKTDPRYRW